MLDTFEESLLLSLSFLHRAIVCHNNYIIIALQSQAIAAEKFKMIAFGMESTCRTEGEMVCHYGLWSNVYRARRKKENQKGYSPASCSQRNHPKDRSGTWQG
jgi:hypothetical protein